jgi:hypothetical protein
MGTCSLDILSHGTEQQQYSNTYLHLKGKFCGRVAQADITYVKMVVEFIEYAK